MGFFKPSILRSLAWRSQRILLKESSPARPAGYCCGPHRNHLGCLAWRAGLPPPERSSFSSGCACSPCGLGTDAHLADPFWWLVILYRARRSGPTAQAARPIAFTRVRLNALRRSFPRTTGLRQVMGHFPQAMRTSCAAAGLRQLDWHSQRPLKTRCSLFARRHAIPRPEGLRHG